MYAFDDCTILNSCELKIPGAYRMFFKSDTLTSKNFTKIVALFQKLNKSNTPKYRFVPFNDRNIIKVGNKLLEGLNVQMLKATFRAEIMSQLQDFGDWIEKSFIGIEKNENIENVKKFFVDNEKNLTKERNIPEDGDLMIVKAYAQYQSSEIKHFITHDEHFWGYKDLILNKFGIKIVEEWNCHLV